MNTTLLDVFNSATRFGSMVVDQDTAKKREAGVNRAEIDLKNANVGIEDDLRKLPVFIGSDNDDENEKLLTARKKEIAGIVDKHFSSVVGRKSSQGYREILEQERKKALSAGNEYALEDHENWRVQNGKIKRDEYTQNELLALKENRRTAEETMSNIKTYNKASASEFKISYEDQYKMDKAAEMTIFQTRITAAASGINDPRQVRAAVEKASREDFAFMGEGWNFAGKKEFLEEVIQGKVFEIFSDKQGEYERMIAAGNIDGANRFAKQWGTEWTKHYDSKNAAFANSNREYRDKGSHWFKRIDEYLREGSGSATSHKISLESMHKYLVAGREGFFENEHERITYYDAFNRYVNDMYKIATDNGYTGSMDNFRRDYPIVNRFLGEAINEMRRTGQYGSYLDSFKIISNFINDGYNNKGEGKWLKGKYADQKQEILNRAEERWNDLLFSVDLANTTPEELTAKTQAFVDSLRGEDLGILQDSQIVWGSGSRDNTVAKAVHALQQPDRVFTDTRGIVQFNGVNEEAVKELETILKNELVSELSKRGENISLDDIIVNGFSESEGMTDSKGNTRYFDQDGFIEFSLEDKPGTKYRFNASMNGNRYEMTLEEKKQSGDWGTNWQ